MEIRNWMKGTSEQRGPCRVGTGALFVHRRSAWPGPGRALLLWVPGVGWSEEKWPRCPTTLCDLPGDRRRPSAGPAACLLLAVPGREGYTRKILKFLAFTSVTNVYYFAPMWWEVSKKSVISLLSLSYLQVQTRGVTVGGWWGPCPAPCCSLPGALTLTPHRASPAHTGTPTATSDKNAVSMHFQQQKALCWWEQTPAGPFGCRLLQASQPSPSCPAPLWALVSVPVRANTPEKSPTPLVDYPWLLSETIIPFCHSIKANKDKWAQAFMVTLLHGSHNSKT